MGEYSKVKRESNTIEDNREKNVAPESSKSFP